MTAIIMVTHFLDKRIIDRYRRLRDQAGIRYDIFLVVQSDECSICGLPDDIRAMRFSMSDLQEMDLPAIAESIVPGSVHFIMIRFFMEYPHSDFYWSVEYDVEMDGDWKPLFSECARHDTDLIACDIQDFDENPYWYWWRAISLREAQVPVVRRTRSFNPIYRLSARAVRLLLQRQKEGDGGHFEVLIPTALKAYGLTLGDLNRNGRYALPNLSRDYYRHDFPHPHGSMRHTPSISPECLDGSSGFLFHPCKWTRGECERTLKEI